MAFYAAFAGTFRQSESTAARRRVPLAVPTGGLAGVQPKISKNGAAFANTANTLVGISDSGTDQAYYVELTAGELDTAGFVIVRYDQGIGDEIQVVCRVLPQLPEDVYARLGAPAGASLAADVAALPEAAEVADAVWDEAVAGHQASGTAGQELHLAKAALVNKRQHTIATGVDVIKDNDGSTTLRTLTPSEAAGVVTVTPG